MEYGYICIYIHILYIFISLTLIGQLSQWQTILSCARAPLLLTNSASIARELVCWIHTSIRIRTPHSSEHFNWIWQVQHGLKITCSWTHLSTFSWTPLRFKLGRVHLRVFEHRVYRYTPKTPINGKKIGIFTLIFRLQEGLHRPGGAAQRSMALGSTTCGFTRRVGALGGVGDAYLVVQPGK